MDVFRIMGQLLKAVKPGNLATVLSRLRAIWNVMRLLNQRSFYGYVSGSFALFGLGLFVFHDKNHSYFCGTLVVLMWSAFSYRVFQ